MTLTGGKQTRPSDSVRCGASVQRLRMTDSTNTIRFRFWLWLIRFIGLIAPRRLAPGVASFNRNKLREINPVAQTPQGVKGNCMREQSATRFKASVMLVAVLG